MSESQKTTTAPTAPAAPEIDPTVETEEKAGLFAKTKHLVKTKKKTTIAVVGLAALVVAASVTGKKQPLPDLHLAVDLEPPHLNVDAEVSSDPDTDA